MKTLVIGIGGVTNGGKTTLARRLKKQLPNCTIISQDDFFKSQSEVAVDEHGFLQYDVLDALYMEEMVASIHSWMANPKGCALTSLNNMHDMQQETDDCWVLIVEGFLLYNYRPLGDVWNKKYFLTIPYEECKKRRSSRIYNPPDPPGYFDGHVWPMYLKNKREMEENEMDIVYLDGTKLQQDLCSRICNDIAQELKKTTVMGPVSHKAETQEGPT
ncbi:nicotinamide riboside kinase 1 isoform X2 [Eublepharis macularius]|uniref:Nicotinamide riboside kinase 1 isoform X2 n=1 Tax=Eublepharis macularius TaxID=481883 RepID=A0AA97L5W0_EUBMA|nr:nicotinamide riboside kinase 1 isoform X2 [Eublepharis macularius]